MGYLIQIPIIEVFKVLELLSRAERKLIESVLITTKENSPVFEYSSPDIKGKLLVHLNVQIEVF